MNVKINDGGIAVWDVKELLGVDGKDDKVEIEREMFYITEIYTPMLKEDNSDQVHSIYFNLGRDFFMTCEEHAANAALQIRDRNFVRFVYGEMAPREKDRCVDMLNVTVDIRVAFDKIVERVGKVSAADLSEEAEKYISEHELPVKLTIALAKRGESVYIIASNEITNTIRQMIVVASADLMYAPLPFNISFNK